MLPVSLPQTCSKLDANCPGNILGWVLAAVAAVVLSLGWVWLRRKPAPTPATEQCAKCGYQFKPLQGGACPHCGETRRLPKY